MRVECGHKTVAPVPMPVLVFVVEIDLGLRIVEEPFRHRGRDVGVRADEATAQPEFLTAFTDRCFGIPFRLFLVRNFNRLLFFRLVRVLLLHPVCREERLRILAADTIDINKENTDLLDAKKAHVHLGLLRLFHTKTHLFFAIKSIPMQCLRGNLSFGIIPFTIFRIVL